MPDLDQHPGEPKRDPDGPGFIGVGFFKYKVEYGVFRYHGENLRGTFDYPEEAQEYIDKHPGYLMAIRHVPISPRWEEIPWSPMQ